MADRRNVFYFEFSDQASNESVKNFKNDMSKNGWDFYNQKNLCFSYGLTKIMTLNNVLQNYDYILLQKIIIRAEDDDISFV